MQSGVDEDMVSKVARFEESDLPDRVKTALRIAQAVATYPKGITDEMWAEAKVFFSDERLADIVFFSAFTTASKITVTLGLDPGPSQGVLYPTDDVYASQHLDEEIEELRRRGIKVSRESPDAG